MPGLLTLKISMIAAVLVPGKQSKNPRTAAFQSTFSSQLDPLKLGQPSSSSAAGVAPASCGLLSGRSDLHWSGLEDEPRGGICALSLLLPACLPPSLPVIAERQTRIRMKMSAEIWWRACENWASRRRRRTGRVSAPCTPHTECYIRLMYVGMQPEGFHGAVMLTEWLICQCGVDMFHVVQTLFHALSAHSFLELSHLQDFAGEAMLHFLLSSACGNRWSTVIAYIKPWLHWSKKKKKCKT